MLVSLQKASSHSAILYLLNIYLHQNYLLGGF